MKRSNRNRLLTCVFAALLSVLIFVGAWSGVSVAEAEVLVQAQAVREAATVTARVVFGEEQRDATQGVWLAGFAAEPGAPPTALAVTFSQVAAGWLGPMWGLQLQSDAGLLPARLNPQEGSAFLEGSQFVLLLTVPPRWGNEYEVSLGYDPATGAASVRVINRTAGQTVLSRNLQLAPYDGTLYPAAGVAAVTGDGLREPEMPVAAVASLDVEPYLVPAEVSWWVMQRSDPEASFLTARQIDRRQETVFRVYIPWETLKPQVALRLIDGSGVESAHHRYDHELDYTPLAVADLAPGTYTAVLEYTFGGRTWELDRRDLVIGTIDTEVVRLAARPTERNTLLLEGELRVQGDGPLGDVAVGLDAVLVHHTFAYDPVTTAGTMAEVKAEPVPVLSPVALAAETETSLSFQAELPWPDVSAPRSLWELRVQPFSVPDAFLRDGQIYQTWVDAARRDEPWAGFLQDERISRLSLAPGVEVISMAGRIAAGPLRMHLLVADLNTPGVSVDALVGQVLTSPATSRWPRAQMSQMVAMSGAIAGVNAAFFDISNTMNPLGIVMQSGDLLKSEVGGMSAHIGFDAEGRPYIGYWQWTGGIQRPDGTGFYPVTGINITTPGTGLTVYRPPAMRSLGTTEPEQPMVELVVRELADPAPPRVAPWDPSRVRVLRGVVEDVRYNEPGIALRPGMFVVAGGGEHGEHLLNTFAVGDVVEIPYILTGATEWPYLRDWTQLQAVVSGGVVLLRNGQYGSGILNNNERHPRTAVGVSLDQSKLYLLVADGRSPLSVGMTYREMADFFRHIGAFHALNLDGGGSTAMAVRDPNLGIVRVLNTPSDGQERYVPDGLGIFYTDLPAVAAEAQ